MPLVNRTFDQLINFTRTTAATFVGSNGLIQTTPQSRNLLTFTEEFDNAAWVKTNTTVTANSTTAPDGTSTADTLTASAGAGSGQQIYQALTSIASGNYVYSIYAKQGSGATDSNLFTVRNQTTGVNAAAISFNYQTGVVTQISGSGATAANVGGGWWRLSIPFTLTATLGDAIRFYAGSTGAVETPGEFIYVWGAQLEVGSTATDYTRNFGGLFPPRFDYDPVTLAPRGLLIEEQRTNLLLRSEEFGNASWSKINGSVTANATTSPDGTVDADLFIPDTTAAVQHRIDQTPVSSAVAQVFSVFVKASGYTWISLRIGTVGRSFNIVNGTVGTAGTMTGTITSFGNGWYRCAIAVPSPLANDICRINVETSDAIAGTFTGDGTSGIFLYGAQLEAGAFATSYIPTAASQVTRTADIAGIAAPNFASWYNGVEGTLLVDWRQGGSEVVQDAISVNDGTISNVINVRSDTSSAAGITPGALVSVGGVTQASLTGSAILVGSINKSAFAYAVDNFAYSQNGAAALTDTSGSVPAVNRMDIGNRLAGTFINGWVRSIRYYPSRLSNAQLQALTA